MWKKRSTLFVAIALIGTLAGAVTHRWPELRLSATTQLSAQPPPVTDDLSQKAPHTAFLVAAGGGAPSYNEIALEKNVRYFQRTLAHLGWNPAISTTLFANGNNGQPTVRYVNLIGRERFKVPDIPHLTGSATEDNISQWFQDYPQTSSGTANCPTFFYFTGHGALQRTNLDNNSLILWEESLLSVQDLAKVLDQWPPDIPFVTMMAQCYSGAFANLIYEGGDPTQPVALQTRCGFFATVKTRPSVGCTPQVNEADYRDYSSSFFAGMSGQDRTGTAVMSADYNADGQVVFAEAHAFAKVDGETSDWPISTSEAWLHRQASKSDVAEILAAPITTLAEQARPEQQYVINALADRLGYSPEASFAESPARKAWWLGTPQAVLTAYRMRLRMELLTVGMETRLRESGNPAAIATLQKLLNCEASTWE